MRVHCKKSLAKLNFLHPLNGYNLYELINRHTGVLFCGVLPLGDKTIGNRENTKVSVPSIRHNTWCTQRRPNAKTYCECFESLSKRFQSGKDKAWLEVPKDNLVRVV